MSFIQSSISPLVSVVIPCYNHAHYLSKAIDSVLSQSYRHVEVVVVDDGSTDNTREVALSYGERVRYVHKQNGGLSAARNTGIDEAKGDYLVFLDADDWLYPQALETNLRYLLQNPEAAFVSGAHDKVFENKNFTFSVINKVEEKHYQSFLQLGNYIGVPAAVMYHRWVLQELRYDETLKACEDYDLYLRIARKYPVLHHTDKVAAYLIRSTSMSSDIPFMLHAALKVLNAQKQYLTTEEELASLKRGNEFWISFYCNELYKKVVNGEVRKTKENLKFLFKNRPLYMIKYFIRFIFLNTKPVKQRETIIQPQKQVVR